MILCDLLHIFVDAVCILLLNDWEILVGNLTKFGAINGVTHIAKAWLFWSFVSLQNIISLNQL